MFQKKVIPIIFLVIVLSTSLISAVSFTESVTKWWGDVQGIFGFKQPSFSPIAKELLEREEPIKIIEEPDSEETSGLIRPGDAGTEPEIIPEVIPEVIPEPEPEPNQTTNQTNITIIPEINETIIIPNITIPPETNQTNVTIIKNETNQTDPQLPKVPVAPLEELAIPKPPKLSYKKTYIGNIAIKDSTKPLETEYYIQDHLGSNMKVVGDEVEQNNEFYAFGEEKASTGDSYNQYKYTGKELDSETGLYYYGARYYDPNLGRFMAADSVKGEIGDPLSLNRYAYVMNNPLKYIDPTGNADKPAADASGNTDQEPQPSYILPGDFPECPYGGKNCGDVLRYQSEEFLRQQAEADKLAIELALDTAGDIYTAVTGKSIFGEDVGTSGQVIAAAAILVVGIPGSAVNSGKKIVGDIVEHLDDETKVIMNLNFDLKLRPEGPKLRGGTNKQTGPERNSKRVTKEFKLDKDQQEQLKRLAEAKKPTGQRYNSIDDLREMAREITQNQVN